MAMLMIVDRSETLPVPEICRQTAGCYGAALSRQPRAGDRIRLPADRTAVEVILGFRPGCDVLVINADPSARLLTTEEAGNVVIIDRAGRRIVLQGVRLSELRTGDIDISAF